MKIAGGVGGGEKEEYWRGKKKGEEKGRRTRRKCGGVRVKELKRWRKGRRRGGGCKANRTCSS